MRKQFLFSAFITITFFLSSCQPKRPDVPHPDHIIVVIEENHGYDDIIGSSAAPYLNKLAAESAVFTDAHGVTHPSQPNYLAIFSGSTQGITNDKCLKGKAPFSTVNLGAGLLARGYTFKGYAESLPVMGSLVCDSTTSTLTGGALYARKHAPWADWQGVEPNNTPDSVSLPMTAFPTDFSKLPTLAFVIPNQDHDMHNIGSPGDSAAIYRGDKWLQDNLSAYADWAKTHNSLLIVTYDEDKFTKQNHILTLIEGAGVKSGKYAEKIDHYNIFHTIVAMYHLPIANFTNVPLITNIWQKDNK